MNTNCDVHKWDDFVAGMDDTAFFTWVISHTAGKCSDCRWATKPIDDGAWFGGCTHPAQPATIFSNVEEPECPAFEKADNENQPC